MMTVPVALSPARPGGPLAPVAALLVGVPAVVMLGVFRSGGSDGFVTDPFATASLAVAAVATAAIGAALVSTGNRLAARYATLLSASLLAYLGASVWAVWAVTTPTVFTPIAVALWNTLWIPPLVLAQLTASAAVRRSRGHSRGRSRSPLWEHVTLVASTALVCLVNPLTERATDPFAGIATVAPEAWASAVEPLGAAATGLGMLALLVLPVRLWMAALSSSGTSRARLGVASAGATAVPMTVVFCLVLAVVRDPGAIDPSIGSTAFLIALAACACFAAVCGLSAARGGIPARRVLAVVRTSALGAAAIVVIALGTLVADPALAWGATAQATAIASIAVVVVAAA